MKIVNEDLYADPKDLEIAKLEFTISEFKKYDAERKGYYSKSLQKLGELESFVQEMDLDPDYISKLRKQMSEKDKIISQLRNIIRANDLCTDQDMVKLVISHEQLSKRNEKLRLQVKELESDIKRLRKCRDQAIYKLYKQSE